MIVNRKELRRLGNLYASQCVKMHNGDPHPKTLGEDKSAHAKAWDEASNQTIEKFTALAEKSGYTAEFNGLYPQIRDKKTGYWIQFLYD